MPGKPYYGHLKTVIFEYMLNILDIMKSKIPRLDSVILKENKVRGLILWLYGFGRGARDLEGESMDK